jgi:hypothetical protein
LSGLSENELKELAMDIQKDTRDTINVNEMKVWLKRCSLFQASSCLKQIAEASNVPIEPDEQTDLAYLTMVVPGVIAAGVLELVTMMRLMLFISKEKMTPMGTRTSLEMK